MSKHTQGPWKSVKRHKGSNSHGWEVWGDATSQAITWWGCVTQTEANARLIAAAPELLSALVEFAMECGPDTGKTQKPSIHPLVLRRALAAIAKATGGE